MKSLKAPEADSENLSAQDRKRETITHEYQNRLTKIAIKSILCPWEIISKFALFPIRRFYVPAHEHPSLSKVCPWDLP